jgi:hypothetical protein
VKAAGNSSALTTSALPLRAGRPDTRREPGPGTQQDRVGSGVLPLSQKFLALMLTVRLASVSEATSALQRAGLIR